MKNVKKMTYAAVLTALAIVIPLAFGFLKIQ
ncbi:ECF transporter S component, partial [Clostridium botulinum]